MLIRAYSKVLILVECSAELNNNLPIILALKNLVSYTTHSSRFPSLGISRLELENPRWNIQVQPRNSEAVEPTNTLI